MLDTTVPVRVPPRGSRVSLRRSAPIVYEQLDQAVTTLGGVFYAYRFLHHFADVRAVVPVAGKGSLVTTLDTLMTTEKDHGLIKSCPVDARVYEARRFMEVGGDFHGWSTDGARNFLRIDWGELKRPTANEVSAFLDMVDGAVKELVDTPGPRSILLTDYDLGLFTAKVIEGIAKSVRHRDPSGEIPVVVYAGRRWRRYYRLPNCTIVAERDEAFGDIADAEGHEHPESIMESPFAWVATRFTHINTFVAVEPNCTKVGQWEHGDNHAIEGIESTLETEYQGSFTPVGHTALIACLATLARMSAIPAKAWLPLAHQAASLQRHVLTGIPLEAYVKPIVAGYREVREARIKRQTGTKLIKSQRTKGTKKPVAAGSR